MNNLYNYEILNNTIKNAKYYFPSNEIIFKNKTIYQYYIFAKTYDMVEDIYHYYILFSNKKFNDSCRNVRIDDYGRLRLKVTNTIMDYIIKLRNFNIKYIKSTEDFDEYEIE